jgi:hypothetical protein
MERQTLLRERADEVAAMPFEIPEIRGEFRD